MQMRDRGFSQRDDHQGYVRQTRYGDEPVDLRAHINAAGPPAQRALGDEEVKLLRLVVQDALALEAGSHSPADVARLIRRLDDPAGVVGGLQQARHHRRLEGRDTPGLLLQLSDLLLLTGQAQAMQDAPAGGTGCQSFEQGGELAELLLGGAGSLGPCPDLAAVRQAAARLYPRDFRLRQAGLAGQFFPRQAGSLAKRPKASGELFA